MHGLNTRQAWEYGLPITRSMGVGSATQAATLVSCADDPFTLTYCLFAGQTNLNMEYWVKRHYLTDIFVNQRPYPCMMRRILLRARADIPYDTSRNWIGISETMNDIISTDTQLTFTMPYFSITTSHDLHKWFKILSQKTYRMKPGIPYKFIQRISRRLLNRAITRGTEGNPPDPAAPQWIFRRGNIVSIYQFYGIPVFNSTTPTFQTTLSDVGVASLAGCYSSWYRMDDADDTNVVDSSVPNTIFPVRDVVLDTQIPSVYQHQQARLQGEQDVGTEFWPSPTFVALANTIANTATVRKTIGETTDNPLHVTP